MDTTLDLSRWRTTPRGIAYRRWTMIRNGLDLLFRLRFFKLLVAIAWLAGMLITLLGFAFSQSVASGGWLESLASHLNIRMQALVQALGGFVTLYPDICVRGFFSLVFWVHSFVGLYLSLIALAIMVPRLITRDRASNALTIYLSRPLTSVDYLLGKLGMVVGMILLLWTGPLVVGWLLSMLFATDRDMIVYSIAPLLRALGFNAIALVTLSAIALGVSALSRTARTTIGLWVGLWFVFGTLAATPHAPTLIQRASFTNDLNQVREQVLRIDTALVDAGKNLPLLDQQFAASLTRAGEKAQAEDFGGALGSLAAFVALSSIVFFRKLRPE